MENGEKTSDRHWQKMKRRVVFALTSEGKDFYSAMTRIAVASIRITNPSLEIRICCDEQTNEACKAVNDPLISEVDHWMPYETPPGPAGFRNRYVKTSLRTNLDGPFLFLDSDVLVRGDLSPIYESDADIAGARNHSRDNFSEQIWDQDQATLTQMGWEVGNSAYINGGVLYLNDTEVAKRFGAEWHKRWLQSFQRVGRHRDQPALNSSIKCTGALVNVLSHEYNAQVKTNTFAANNARIWHFYSDSHMPGFFDFDDLVSDVLRTSQLELADVKRIQEKAEPWRSNTLFQKIVARRISKQDYAGGWEVSWLSGHHMKALRELIRSGLQGISVVL